MIEPKHIAEIIERDYNRPDATWQYLFVQASLYMIEGEALVIFRGTGSNGWDVWADWFRNFRAYPVKHFEIMGRAAAGYLNGAKGVLKARGEGDEQMQHTLAKLSRTGVPVHFAGHSKGGAESAVAARICLSRGVCYPKSLTTFGSARPGRFKLPCKCSEYRYRGDPVPWVAPWNRHVSKIIQVGGTGKPSVKDHKITNYQRCV